MMREFNHASIHSFRNINGIIKNILEMSKSNKARPEDLIKIKFSRLPSTVNPESEGAKPTILTPLDMRLIYLHQLRAQIEYLYNPGNSSFEKIVKDSLFFYQCYNNAKGIFIIELCKLMNKGENHNFGKYIKSVCENSDPSKTFFSLRV